MPRSLLSKIMGHLIGWRLLQHRPELCILAPATLSDLNVAPKLASQRARVYCTGRNDDLAVAVRNSIGFT